MKLSGLDIETKRVVVIAHIYLRSRTDENLEKLCNAIKEFDKKHAKEQVDNLLRVLEEADVEDAQ